MRAWGYSPVVDTKEKRPALSRSRSKSRDKDTAKVAASDSTPQARRKHRSNSRWRRDKESKLIDDSDSALKKESEEKSSIAEHSIKKETTSDKSGKSDKSENEAGSHSERENSQSKTKKSRKHKRKCKESVKEDGVDLANKTRKKNIVSNKNGDEESNEAKIHAAESGMDTTKVPPESEEQKPRKTGPKIVLLGRTAKKMKRGFKKAPTQVVEDPEKSLDQDEGEQSKAGLASKEATKIKAGLRQARSKMMSKPVRQAKSKMMSKPLLRKENSKAKKEESESESVSESVESSESSEMAKQKRKSKKKKRTKKKKSKKKRGKNDVRKVRSEPPQVVTHMPTFVAVPGNFPHHGLMSVRPLPGSVQMMPMQGGAAAFAKFGGMPPLGQSAPAESSNKLSSSELRALIKGIYERHNPAKLSDFGSLMQKYEGFENDVYLYVCKKYGEQPEPGTVDVDPASIALPKPKAKTMAVAKKASAFPPLKPRAKASSADSPDPQQMRDSNEEDSSGWPFVGEDYSDGGSSSSSSAPMRSEVSQSLVAKEPVVEQLRLASGARMPLCKGHLMRGIGQGWPSIVHSSSRYTRDAERFQGKESRKHKSSDDASKTLSDFLATCNAAPTVSAASSTDKGVPLQSIGRRADSQADVPQPVAPEWQDPCTKDDTLCSSEIHESKESPKIFESSKEVCRQDLEEAVVSLAELPPEDDVMQHEGSTTEESRSPSPCRGSGTIEMGVNLQIDEAGGSSGVCMESASENVCKADGVDVPRNGNSFKNNMEGTGPLDKAALTSPVAAKGAEETLPSHAIFSSSSENKMVNSTVESVTEAQTATTLEARDSTTSRMISEALDIAAASSSLQTPQSVAPAPIVPSQSLVLPAKETISVMREAVSTPSVQPLYEATPVANETAVATLVPEVAEDASEKVLTKSLLEALDAAERSDPQLKPTTLPMGSGTKSAPTPAQQAALSRLMHLTSFGKSQTKAVATSPQPVETPVSAGSAEQVQSIQQASASTATSQVAASARVADLPVPPPPPGPPPPDIPQAPLVTGLGWAGVPLHWAQIPFSPAQLFPATMIPAAPPPPPRPPN